MEEIVQAYYGQTLQSSADLRTSACCDADAVPGWLKPLLARVHPQVSSRYYGCGLVAPPLLEGCRVLDLGSGSGRDVYLLAQLVGPKGSVVGVDMTTEQLAVARAHQPFHAEQFGFDNVAFLEGHIEHLEALALEPASFDVIVSNCVLNLSTDKPAVLRGVQRLLKPGGEFYFSDVYADRRLPEPLRSHPVLYGECLGGALYWNDFLRLARAAGFADPRLVSDRPLEITDPELAALLGETRFFSAEARFPAAAIASTSTSTTVSRSVGWCRFAATRPACCSKRASHPICRPSVISVATTACLPVVAVPSPLRLQQPQPAPPRALRQQPVAAEPIAAAAGSAEEADAVEPEPEGGDLQLDGEGVAVHRCSIRSAAA
jgi:SAM-dependent methyltransferase